MKLRAICLILPLLPGCRATSELVPSWSDGESLEVVFDRVHTSVVTIETVGRSTMLDDRGDAVLQSGIGSGVLIDAEGRIMTAAHVVQTAEAVRVHFSDGTSRDARTLGTVPVADLALIQINGKLPEAAVVAPLADSASARVGSRVFVIGSPRGISHTLTVGHLSAQRELDLPFACRCPVELLQTDAAINKGNSGGPMFNMSGEVLGIVSHIVSESGGSEGLGFAIGSNAARTLLLEGDIFWSGIETVALSGPFAQAFNLPDGRSGALVQTVARGSVGSRIGLKGGTIKASIAGQDLLIGGDILLAVLGIDISDPALLTKSTQRLRALRPTDTVEVEVEVLRGGTRVTLSESFGKLVDSK